MNEMGASYDAPAMEVEEIPLFILKSHRDAVLAQSSFLKNQLTQHSCGCTNGVALCSLSS